MAVNRDDLEGRVREALAGVQNPRTGVDVVASENVRGIELSDEGDVRVQFALRPDDPGSIVRDVRAAVEAVQGVTKVRIKIDLPKAPQQQGGGRRLQPGSVPAPTPDTEITKNVDHIVAVSSGKGGVGKSTVAANLAAVIAAAGHRVGLLDADVYGPNIPVMFGEKRRPKVTGEKGQEKIVPLEAHGVLLMSLGFLLEDEQPAIMRGPLVSGILKQFLEQVEWGPLEYLIVDMPPGTGDAQLSLVQTVDLDGAVLVTTPQDVATGDVRRAIRMFERVRTPVLGVVENMSGFTCPHCGEHADIFGEGGGRKLAMDMNVPFLAAVPLDVAVREAGDAGRPTSIFAPDSPAGRAFTEMAERVLATVSAPVPTGS
jgi:ATP-binding protein involved in chromosome partitioning